ncbi:hypothetical protein [Aneurinibacillus tyrosinisolvens]|uniref:hypothetical protein n=1 Tax=Aneurinibacillus tyrosinisolvens TaxID=1443435 RepID=UPI0013791E1C|nr:hypothetical protein [Aneurinibacillus tyrosinisolvens]
MISIHRSTFLTSEGSHQFTLHVEDPSEVCTLSGSVMAKAFRPTVSVPLYLFGFPVAFRRNGIRFLRHPLPAGTSIDVAIALLLTQIPSGLPSSTFHRYDGDRWVLYSGQDGGRSTVTN